MNSLVPTEYWDYGFADAIRGMRTALNPQPSNGNTRILIPELGNCIPVRSARAALVVALKTLSLPDGALVAVPLYCCPVVLSAIKMAGYRARFVDVDPSTFCMSATDLAAKSANIDAVIVVHMFGNVCDMPALRQARPGKPFIEDCAQGLGSRIGGQPAGSLGEIAVFSFRSGKYISAGEGGAIYCKEAALEVRTTRLINELATSSRTNDLVHVLKTYLKSALRRKPLWGLVGSRLWSAYSEKVAFTAQAPIVMGRIFPTDYATAMRRLSMLGSFIEKQRSNADHYSRNLDVQPDMICRETQGNFFNRLQYSLLLSTPEQCAELAVRLEKEKISTARPYKDIVSIATEHYGYSGDCPQSEYVAKRILVIPCNYDLTPAELDKITNSVNRAWREMNSRGHGVLSNAVRDAVSTNPQNTRKASGIV